MNRTNDVKAAYARLIAAMEKTNLRYLVTGGLVSSFYGDPRYTQDIDIVIQIVQGNQVAELVSALEPEFTIEPEAIEEAIHDKSMFQALYEETLVKVDFHVGEAVPGELQRSVMAEIVPGVIAPIVTKEDAILSKLLWIKLGSHKSRQDVQFILKRQEAIDEEYLNRQAIKLDVSDLLTELKTSEMPS